MPERIEDPVAKEMFVNHVISARENGPTVYTPPPKNEKWKMYLAVGILPMSGADKAVLVCLIDHANTKNGQCYPGQAVIAFETDMSERTVKRSVGRLISQGYVARLRRGRIGRGGRSTNAYQVNWPKLTEAFDSYTGRRNAKRNAGSRNAKRNAGSRNGPM